MGGDDYVIDGDLAFSNKSDALKFYQEQYHKKKEWQGLTNEEILEEYRQSYGDDGNLTDVYFARAIEAKLKGKNT
jgi:hypothetical protein